MHSTNADPVPDGAAPFSRRSNARLLVVAGTLVALITTGALVGWLGAERIQTNQVKQELDRSAQRILARLAAIIDESEATFARIEQSGLAHCSDGMLLAMRTELFEARFLRDIGGIDGRELVCSTALGRMDERYRSGPPDLRLATGTALRTDRSVLASASMRSLVVEREPFNALIHSGQVTDLMAGLDDSEIFLAVADSSRTPADWHPFKADAQTAGQGRRNHFLAASTCLDSHDLCVQLRRQRHLVEDAGGELRGVMTSLGGAAGLSLFFLGLAGFRQYHTPERDLARAIANDQIRPAYQPILTLPDHRLVGFEALARWRDSSHTERSAEAFIQLAENSGQIQDITSLMVRRIGEELGEWLSKNPERHVAINIAPAELADPGLPDKLDRHLLARGVQPGQIILEITERTMLTSADARRHIEVLTQHGFCLYADDFGVGYCGLAYLIDLDIHGIKLSQTLTAAVATDSPKAALVPRVSALARELGLAVVVEGVETEAQCQALSEIGPVMVQGWYFAPPLSARQLIRFFDR